MGARALNGAWVLMQGNVVCAIGQIFLHTVIAISQDIFDLKLFFVSITVGDYPLVDNNNERNISEPQSTVSVGM